MECFFWICTLCPGYGLPFHLYLLTARGMPNFGPRNICTHLPYGVAPPSDGTLDKEENVRIGKASGAFNSLNNIWKNQGILLQNKIAIYESAVITQLLYACSSWALTKQQLSRLEAFHHNCLRRILKVKWFHHTTNQEVRRKTRCCSIWITISSIRLRYFGHVARMPSSRLPRFMLDWIPRHSKRSVGHRKLNLIDCINNDIKTFADMDECGMDIGKTWASNKPGWRKFITKSKERLQSNEQADPQGCGWRPDQASSK